MQQPERVAIGVGTPGNATPFVVFALHLTGDTAELLYLDYAAAPRGASDWWPRLRRAVEAVTRCELVCDAPVLIVTDNGPGAVGGMVRQMLQSAPSLKGKTIEFLCELCVAGTPIVGVPFTRELYARYLQTAKNYAADGRLVVSPKAMCGDGRTVDDMEARLRRQIDVAPGEDRRHPNEWIDLAETLGMTLYWVERRFPFRA